MNDKERLAEIIKGNQGAVAYIDNDYWSLRKPTPAEYDTWGKDEQEQWYETCELANSDQFDSFSSLHGWGLLEAMATILDITIEGV